MVVCIVDMMVVDAIPILIGNQIMLNHNRKSKVASAPNSHLKNANKAQINRFAFQAPSKIVNQDFPSSKEEV